MVFDLGANHGLFAHELIKRVGCRVFAAEPVSDLRATITRSDKLTLLPLALGGSNGRVRLNVFEGRCASIVPSTAPDDLTLRTEEVAVVTLAEFLKLTGTDRVDLMKVDIEGAELDLLEAAAEDELKRIAQITVEFHDFIYPALRSRVENVKERLRSLGFRMIKWSLDNTDVLFLNCEAVRLSTAQYWALKYVTRNFEGAKRRLHRRFSSRSRPRAE